MATEPTPARIELAAALNTVHEQNALIERLLRERTEPIAIIGLGLRLPGDNTTPDGFARFLDAGRSGTIPIPPDRWDVAAFTPNGGDGKGKVHTAAGGFVDGIDRFDAMFFNISPKEARCVDPQQRLILETSWEALENANIDPTGLRNGTGGAYFGASSIDYALEISALAGADMDGHIAAGVMHAAISGRASYFLGLRGPCLTVDTACSASLVALHLAVSGLRNGECDIALCGGVNAIHHPSSTVLLSDMRALAPDGLCKTFDESADGYGRAEGCGVIVLKRLSDAQRDGDTMLAVIRGSAVRQDGESAGLTVPNGAAQEAVMRAALRSAGLEPGDIQYVEAHGTGTPLGDPIELAAINEVFAASHCADDPLMVASLKTNIGHLEAAAGIGGVIKTVLQLRAATVFPHRNLDTPSSRIPWQNYPVLVPVSSQPWQAPLRRALVNSFGFTGTISSVVLEQAPAAAPRPAPTADPHGDPVFTLSAKTLPALGQQIRRYQQFLAQPPVPGIGDLCYTANLGRSHFRHRVAGVVHDHAELAGLLDRELSAVDSGERTRGPARKVAFLCTGQGSHYPGMGAELYRRHPAFAKALDECDGVLAPLIGRSVTALVTDPTIDTAELGHTRWAQPALFALEYALAQLWLSWGVRPGAVIGHSLGEVVAATLAGLFTLPDAARLVAARARLMGSVRTAGGMASVAAPAETVTPLLAGRSTLAVAAINSPRQCVISGGQEELAEVVATLADQGVSSRPLPVSHAFHSPLMTEITHEFRATIHDIGFQRPDITFVPARRDQGEVATVDYWVRRLIEPVDFQAGMQALHQRGKHVFIEIGPSAALTSLGRQCLPAKDHVWLRSLRESDLDDRAIIESVARGYAAGLPISWDAFHRGQRGHKVELPTYAFDRQRHWLPVGDRRGSTEPAGMGAR